MNLLDSLLFIRTRIESDIRIGIKYIRYLDILFLKFVLIFIVYCYTRQLPYLRNPSSSYGGKKENRLYIQS